MKPNSTPFVSDAMALKGGSDDIKALNDTMTATFSRYAYSVVVAERDRDPEIAPLGLHHLHKATITGRGY